MAKNNYIIFHEFFIQYKNDYEDYLLCKKYSEIGAYAAANKVASSSLCVTYDQTKAAVVFETTDVFLSQTLGEIKEVNENAASKTSSLIPRSTYYPSLAANYAMRYALSYNPAYPDMSAEGDCTNFVSQCLYSGGISMVGTRSYAGTFSSTTEWFCKDYSSGILSAFAVSTSWSRATDFTTYMRGVANTVSDKFYISHLHNSCAVGDVVMLAGKYTETAYHAIIISAKDSSKSYYCGHTTDRYNHSIEYLDEVNDRFIFFDFT